MSVSLELNNIYKYAHVHCYVIDSKSEGYAKTNLKRYLEVEDIIPINISQEEAKCKAILNVDEPRADELEQIRWTVETKEVLKYKGKEQILHNLKEEKVNEINFTSYIEGFKQKAANARLSYDQRVKEQEEKQEIKQQEEKTDKDASLTKEDKSIQIVDLYYVTRTKEFVALTKEESEELQKEEDEIHSLIKPLLENENDIDKIDEVKKQLHEKLQSYGINPQTNSLTEIRRVSGRKFTYIRSDKMKNHIRRYSMQNDDKKRSKVRSGGKLDLEKLKKELTQKDSSIEIKWKTSFDNSKFGR